MKAPNNPIPIEKLKQVMRDLRHPETGCPWDQEQTFESILPHTIEEAYEVADAIERADMDDLKDELGDLLLQVIYHAEIANEKGLFNFDDVADDVATKMISRHPHVFGDMDASSADDVHVIWEQQKELENGEQGALDSVTRGLPALLRAKKLQKKAAKVGFVWPSSAPAFDKVVEEIHEFKDAKTPKHKEEEFGDILYALVNYARMEGINAEEALRKTNEKFITRFKGMETSVKETGQKFSSLSLEEMMSLWQKQK